ncbi:MAG: DNA recombination protein RmuC [Bacteroidetes bacterium]|nr:DNA recombination protein RmuC [Bacteroidota bacterium]
MEIVFLLIGLLLGAGIVWLLLRFRYEAINVASDEKLRYLQKELEANRTDIEQKEKQIIDLNRNLSGKEADLRNISERLLEQKGELEKIQDKFRLEFKNLANEILEEKTKKFTEQNKSNLSDILGPLKEKITDFEKKVDQSNKESIDRNAALRQQINGLKELNLKMTTDAENLTKALKGESKTMGNWGEFVLESILEKSGLVKGREYEIQESVRSEEGSQMRPDIVVKLPEKKHIIIDSKVSLVDYEKYVNTENKEKEKYYLKRHIDSLKRHIKSLSAKKYQNLYDIAGLDFVLLFMPVEPAFSLAVQAEENLFMDAYEMNIVIVSPTTLIATLRTIASIWRQEYQNRNAQEIARQGGALYDKFVGFLNDLVEVGKKLDDTQKAYKASMNKLSDGKGNLIKKVQDIKELGASTSKTLPQNLLDKEEGRKE